MTTPAPWITDECGNIWGPEHPKSKHKNKRELIGQVIDNKGRREPWPYLNSNGNIDEQGQANARLIAAAPELLDVCELALIYFENILTDSQTGDVLREAIRKATGREI